MSTSISDELIAPAFAGVFACQEAKLLALLRSRHYPFQIRPGVWRRLSDGLADWQAFPIRETLRLDFSLMGDIPYYALNQTELRQFARSLETRAAVTAFRAGLPARAKTRDEAEAVRFYIKQVLNCPKGMLWLATRQPKGMTLVDRTLHLYATAMDLCFERVSNDRGYLARCFLDGNPIETLDDVIITDSDPHKGGKRVLFLDFGYRSAGKAAKRRVVYKPSDVEIDYRLAGKNTPEIRRLCQEESAGGRFPQPHESFFEMLDRLALLEQNHTLANAWSEDAATRQRLEALLGLPTYKILPRNPGSRLQPDPQSARLPIDQSYGYLEYLAFQPQLPELGNDWGPMALSKILDYLSQPARWRLDPLAGYDTPDCVVDNQTLAKPAFRVWGRLMSIASVLLQTDLHHQNQRLHQLKPFIIDLENCLIKPCRVPGGYDGTLIPVFLRRFDAMGGKATNNQLYLCQAGQAAQWLSIDDASSALQVKEGIRDALLTMQKYRSELANWIQASGFAELVVRHVTEPTGDLTAAADGFNARLLAEENIDQRAEDLLERVLARRYQTAKERWLDSGPDSYVRQDNPKYALECPAYNGTDFEDRCVPVYYRQAGSRDLLTWRGEVVRYQPRPDDSPEMAFAYYHKNTGLDLLKTSLRDKLPDDAKKREQVLRDFIQSVYPQAPNIPGVRR